MVKVLSRDAVQRMTGRRSSTISTVSGGGGDSGVSQAWVEEHYISKDFFNQLFTVHGTRTYIDEDTQEEVTEEVVITPNAIADGDEYKLSNVEVSVGLWTQQFLSALGLNPGGGGGGGATSLAELVDVALSSPQNGQALVYNSSTRKWVNGTVIPDLTDYATKSWVQQQGYITSSALTDYATQSWVQQQGYLTSSALTGYATQSWVQQQGYLTSSSLTGYATQSWVQQQGYLTNHQSVDGTFWGQSWTNHGSVSGNIENVDIIFQTGNNILMHQHGIGLMIEGSAVTGNEYRASFGFHPAGSLSWLYTNTVMQLKVNTATGENLVHINNGILQIGDARLVYDSTNNALKAIKADGTSLNFYATGGVSALGMSAGVSQVDAMTFNYVTINNNLELGAVSRITHAVTNDDRTLYIGNSDNSGWVALQDVCSQRGISYWKIMANGEALFAEKVQSPKFYLDSTRYIYVNGGTLYYFNGSTSRQIAFA